MHVMRHSIQFSQSQNEIRRGAGRLSREGNAMLAEPKILCVEDDPADQEALRGYAEILG